MALFPEPAIEGAQVLVQGPPGRSAEPPQAVHRSDNLLCPRRKEAVVSLQGVSLQPGQGPCVVLDSRPGPRLTAGQEGIYQTRGVQVLTHGRLSLRHHAPKEEAAPPARRPNTSAEPVLGGLWREGIPCPDLRQRLKARESSDRVLGRNYYGQVVGGFVSGASSGPGRGLWVGKSYLVLRRVCAC